MSDSSSDDEENKRLLEALDTTLLSDEVYRNSGKKHTEEQTDKITPRSLRYIECDEENAEVDTAIPPKMKDFFWKKLCQILSKQYEFLDLDKQNIKNMLMNDSDKYGIKLLVDCDTVVRDLPEVEANTKRKKPNLKRRNVDLEFEQGFQEENLRTVVVDGNYILSGTETTAWNQQPKKEPFCYKQSKSGVLHYIESENEFTKLRKKNCWSEKYICKKRK